VLIEFAQKIVDRRLTLMYGPAADRK